MNGEALAIEPVASDERVSAILRPLSPEPCGEDPSHGERFAEIRSLVNQLGGGDFQRLESLCRTLLAEESKDIRVAAYLVLASANTAGVSGVLEAVAIFHGLVRNFWSDCHPRRVNARINAFGWLNTHRLAACLDARHDAGSVSREQIVALRDAMAELNASMHAVLGEEVRAWSGLDDWIAKRLKRLLAPPPSGTESPPPVQRASSDSVSSTTGLDKASRAIIDYLKQQQEWLRVVAFGRAWRWGSLALPPAVDGVTQVPAPRSTAPKELETARNGDSPKQLFLLCEALLLEPGGQFWLDLQLHSAKAARAMGVGEAAEHIEAQTVLLLDRLPDLETLRFNDSSAFASGETLSWLVQLRGEQEPLAVRQVADEHLDEIEAAAVEAAEEGGLPAGLALLDTAAGGNESQRFRLGLSKADLCTRHDRIDLALALLEQLDERVMRYGLAEWEPSLALEVWTRLRGVLRSRRAQAPEAARMALSARVERVDALICQTDAALAARILDT